ncbi:MAG: AMP phosphorylase [Candidatus Altiarchaeales archaeon IMC4]|nr:MAG: AMP phosphorylase [Candidatus Altiarchaeales archaeon IMC4]
MKLKAKIHRIEAGEPVVVLNKEDAEEMGIFVSDRVRISADGKSATALVDLTASVVKKGEIGLLRDVWKVLPVEEDQIVDVVPTERPKSVDYIRKKIDGLELHGHEIREIVQDIVDNNLSGIELGAFITSTYITPYTMDETVALTNAMVETGKQMDFGTAVVDKHCIGGVAGNRTTMLIVPIVAAAGLTIPKTSSRAITSPAGTADTMGVLADVEFEMDELIGIVKKTGGCIIWGGNVNLAPADDKIIRVEYPLSIDPEGQLLASVMAKKKSIGSDYVVIDIPVGVGAKVKDIDTADKLAHKFIELGKRLGISVKCLVTDGSEPIGRGIGPALEARDVLLSLDNKGPRNLTGKSLDLAGILIEMSGKVQKGKGRDLAEEILSSGAAMMKMREIIDEQNGNPDIKPDDIIIGKNVHEVKSAHKGVIRGIDNKLISHVARAAGAPKDPEAGVYLNMIKGDCVNKGDTLFTIYATKGWKLDEAIALTRRSPPVDVGGVILEEVD